MKDIIIIGAGGLGKEVADIIGDIKEYNLIGFLDDDPQKKGILIGHTLVLGGLEYLFDNKGMHLVIAIASPELRKSIVEELKEFNFIFPNIIHPSAVIGSNVEMGIGNIIGYNVILSTETELGDFVIINPQCGLGHESSIGDYSTLYWNVSIGGNVVVGNQCQLGTKSFIKQQIRICEKTFIGAGAVVVKNITLSGTYIGVPAIFNNRGN